MASRAQNSGLPVVGFLHSGGPQEAAHIAAGCRRGLRDAGFIDGQIVNAPRAKAPLALLHPRVPVMLEPLITPGSKANPEEHGEGHSGGVRRDAPSTNHPFRHDGR